MKWFRRKKEEVSVPEPSRCFREKVGAFWTWWSCHSERILESVNENGGRAIQPEISDQVSWLCPDLAWVFGPAPDGNGHSFTLSSEGDATQRFLIGYWLERAPQLPGWTFYPCRQPSTELEGAKIAIGKIEVEAKSLWISSSIDVEREKIDITAWSPHFGDIKEEQAWRILYLFLDAALGEDRTERCLGSIDLGDDRLSHSFPLTELRLHVEHVFAEHG